MSKLLSVLVALRILKAENGAQWYQVQKTEKHLWTPYWNSCKDGTSMVFRLLGSTQDADRLIFLDFFEYSVYVIRIVFKYIFFLFQTPCTSESFNYKERDNFADLLSELSRKLRPHNLEISAMVTASPEIAQLAYKPHILASELDWVAVAANDYYASSTGKTSYLVPLQSSHGSNNLVS